MSDRVEYVAKALFNARYLNSPELDWEAPAKNANAYAQKSHKLSKDACRLDAKEFLALLDAAKSWETTYGS